MTKIQLFVEPSDGSEVESVLDAYSLATQKPVCHYILYILMIFINKGIERCSSICSHRSKAIRGIEFL